MRHSKDVDKTCKRIGFSLIRVFRFQQNREQVATDNVLLSQLKWPIEIMYIGLRPVQNISSTNTNQWRDWHNLNLLTNQVINRSSTSTAMVVIDDTVPWNAGTGKTKQSVSNQVNGHITYPEPTQVIQTLQLQAHGINIYQQYPFNFYRDYQPYIYGGVNLITPEDQGALMMNFCLYPGTYQPSGHINVSRAREFYLQFTSNYCSANTPCDLIVQTKCKHKKDSFSANAHKRTLVSTPQQRDGRGKILKLRERLVNPSLLGAHTDASENVTAELTRSQARIETIGARAVQRLNVDQCACGPRGARPKTRLRYSLAGAQALRRKMLRFGEESAKKDAICCNCPELYPHQRWFRCSALFDLSAESPAIAEAKKPPTSISLFFAVRV